MLLADIRSQKQAWTQKELLINSHASDSSMVYRNQRWPAGSLTVENVERMFSRCREDKNSRVTFQIALAKGYNEIIELLSEHRTCHPARAGCSVIPTLEVIPMFGIVKVADVGLAKGRR